MVKLLRYFFTFLGSALLTVLIAIFLVTVYFSTELPDFNQLKKYELPIASRLYTMEGKLFAEYASERRSFVPIEYIPQKVINGFLAAEDRRFFQHSGIDFSGLFRAFVTNLKNIGTGRRLVGGSTITQQVVKNFLLSGEQKLIRKIKEAILAFRVENALDKKRILELYLNQLFLGKGCYGVGAAALRYFNKSLAELDTAEIAFLAGLPKAPNNYDPNKYPKAAKERRDYVLKRMYEERMINLPELNTALAKEIVIVPSYRGNFVQGKFFAEEVRRQIVKDYGLTAMYENGFVVRTTLSTHYQNLAENALKNGLLTYDKRHGWRGALGKIILGNKSDIEIIAELKATVKPEGSGDWQLAVVTNLENNKALIMLQDSSYGVLERQHSLWARKKLYPSQEEELLGPDVEKMSDIFELGDIILVRKDGDKLQGHRNLCYLEQVPEVNGAIIAMEPHSGRILAMAGGYTFDSSQFNRATQAKRQPGSIFKPFVYLTALENGFQPNSMILDGPLTIPRMDGGPDWQPQNITKKFYGWVTLRSALERSFNPATIKLLIDIGILKLSRVVRKLGVMEHMPPELAVALGSGESTLHNLTRAFAILVNGGREVRTTFIDRIQDRHGRHIYRHDSRECTNCGRQTWNESRIPQLSDDRKLLVNPISAYQIVSILEGSTKRGSARRLSDIEAAVAGKTGSTDDYRSAWFIGMIPDLVVGVYVGFDSHKSMGDRETGSRLALPIFKEFIRAALKSTAKIPFRLPKDVKLVRINHKTGQPAQEDGPDILWEAFKPEDLPERQ